MESASKKNDFVFFGTPDVARDTLEILKLHGYLPTCVVTAPDRPMGRHFTITPPPVKTWALENNIPCIQPEKLDDVIFAQIPRADLYIVVAYGKIIPQTIIDLPKLGIVNIHYSLLPKWRGASPIEAAILHGDIETGVSIQKMIFKLDAGPVIATKIIPIAKDDTTVTLREKLIPLGAELLVSVIEKNNFTGIDQDESQASRCGKIEKQDGLIDLFKDDPQILWNKYRAYIGWPGIFFFDNNNKRIKITKAKLENNTFVIERVIPEGKNEIVWTK